MTTELGILADLVAMAMGEFFQLQTGQEIHSMREMDVSTFVVKTVSCCEKCSICSPANSLPLAWNFA
jgi:hypothetical protein